MPNHIELQVENLRGNWTGIAQGEPDWIGDQIETFNMNGYCVRIKDSAGVVTEFLAEPHGEES